MQEAADVKMAAKRPKVLEQLEDFSKQQKVRLREWQMQRAFMQERKRRRRLLPFPRVSMARSHPYMTRGVLLACLRCCTLKECLHV